MEETSPVLLGVGQSTKKHPTAVVTSGSPAVLLRAMGISKAFGGHAVIARLDLTLRQGEVVLLRGENGSGKTTLLNILTGSLEPDAGEIEYRVGGKPRIYKFPRRWWEHSNPFDHFTPEFVAREGVGRTWQDVRLFGAQTLRDNIVVADPAQPGENPAVALFAPFIASRRDETIRREAELILERLGLACRQESSADRISLGQSKRVAIARAIAAGARILFLDEPLTGLDGKGIASVLRLLEGVVESHQVTLVIVEHVSNEPHLRALVTTDWRLDKSQMECTGTGARGVGVGIEQAGRPAWFGLLAGAHAEVVDESLPRGALLTRIRPVRQITIKREPVLEIRDLVVKRGFRTVIGRDDIGEAGGGFALTLFTDEVAVLQAPNGWGKSTLLAAIAGLIPSTGRIVLDGRDIVGKTTWQRIALGLRVVTSDSSLFASLRVRDVCRLAGRGNFPSVIDSLANRYCGALSGGEKRRVALLLGALGGKIRLLDEPFSALDATSLQALRELVATPPALVVVPRGVD